MRKGISMQELDCSCLGITEREHVSSFHWNNRPLLWLGRKQQCKAQFCKGWIFLEVFTLPPDLSLGIWLENHFCKFNFSLSCSSAHCNSAFPTAAATSFCVFNCNPNFSLALVTHFATCQSSFSNVQGNPHQNKVDCNICTPLFFFLPIGDTIKFGSIDNKEKKKKMKNKSAIMNIAVKKKKKLSTCCTYPGKITACEIWKPFRELSKAMD